MDTKSIIVWNLLTASMSGNYLQCFDFALALAYVTKSQSTIERLESLKEGVPIKGVRIRFTYLVHQYSRMKEDRLSKRIKLEVGGRTKHKVSVGELLEGIRFVHRVILISCFEIMEEQKIQLDISGLYNANPARETI